MDPVETVYLLRQLAAPVEFKVHERAMFDYAGLKFGRDYTFMKGFAYFHPGLVLARVKRLGAISRSLKV